MLAALDGPVDGSLDDALDAMHAMRTWSRIVRTLLMVSGTLHTVGTSFGMCQSSEKLGREPQDPPHTSR